MKLVGLTGGIASGKSTVAAILKRLGAAIINADDLSREVVQPGQDAWKEIVENFGAAILQDDKTLDRRKLRKMVFDNPEARKKLEAIIHPKVRALAEERIRELAAAGNAVIVYEVPLLFEGQLHHWLRPVILVACDTAMQKKRLQDRDHLTTTEAQQHIAAQMSLEEKRKLADYIIENNGSMEDLEQQVKSILETIQAT
ncbi:MAG TPA: dephospho-CoA kinase [Methylomirabilota bacterium]|nr:dephospho-CoA kinase [Methylomirabilota bacterium]